MKNNNFDYSTLEESRLIQEIEYFKTVENIEIAEDNLAENRVKAKYRQFLKDSGLI